jgi:hypothetical protein
MSPPTRRTAAGQAYLDLQNRARAEGRGTQELLTLYVAERTLSPRFGADPEIGTAVRPGGADLAPEVLHERASAQPVRGQRRLAAG